MKLLGILAFVGVVLLLCWPFTRQLDDDGDWSHLDEE